MRYAPVDTSPCPETNFSRRLCSPKGTKWFYFRNHPMNTIGRLLVCLYYLGKMKYNGHKSINVIFPRLARSGNDGNVYVLVYVRSTQNITVQYGDPYRSNIFNLGVIFLKLFSWPLCKGVTLHSGDRFDSVISVEDVYDVHTHVHHRRIRVLDSCGNCMNLWVSGSIMNHHESSGFSASRISPPRLAWAL